MSVKERTPEQIQAAKDRMAKARAGIKKQPKPAVIPGTVPLESVQAHPENDNGHNGNGHTVGSSPVAHSVPPKDMDKFKAVLNALDPIGNTFSTSNAASGLTLLAVPGDDVTELPMRSNFPDRRYLIACSEVLNSCRMFHYEEGEKQLLFLVAGLCGIHGERAKMLVDAVIGERKNKEYGGNKNFFEKVRDKILE